jgi:tetratricopeptide (TPR) repeat protein
VVLLSACASAPWHHPDSTAPTDQSAADTAAPGSSAPGSTANAGPGGAGSGAKSAVGPAGPPSARATADFNRAVGFMRSGNATEAELEFKQMTLSYPRLSTPFVNLGILYRKAGRLDQSEEALKGAVERNGTSAVAWNELGATQRLRGEFPDAAASYERAIAADSNFAPAYRNLGVVSDLYLGDPERALTALERYKELTGEDRPVTSWIAELRQRTGKPPLKPAGAAPAPNSSGSAAAPGAAAAPASGAPADGGAGNAGSAPAGTTGAAPAAAPSKDSAPSKNATPATKPAPKAGG